MNLMEIGKKPEIQPTETADQMKNLPDTTDKWKQLAKEQAASLELVTEERDELQVRNQKMNEFIQKFQERTHKLKMEKQNLFFENHEMQDEIRKFVAKPLRMALGALIIQTKFQFSDRELVEQIAENPYLQYFIGLPGFREEAPFDASTLVLSVNAFQQIC